MGKFIDCENKSFTETFVETLSKPGVHNFRTAVSMRFHENDILYPIAPLE